MAEKKNFMKAPEGTSHAEIDGTTYDIPTTGKKAGIIEVRNPNHIETLKRHGFTEHFDDNTDWAAYIDAKKDNAKDKAELVEFIEERGGDADTDMTLSKLQKRAHKVLKD